MDKRLLEDYDDDSCEQLQRCSCQKQQRKIPSRVIVKYVSIAVGVQLLLTLAALFTFRVFPASRLPQQQQQHQEQYSFGNTKSFFRAGVPELFDHLVSYKIEHSSDGLWENNLFFGLPSNESELAWNDLLVPRSFRLYKEEAQALSISGSIRLKPNGEDVAAILGLKHNLHCLRSVRQMMYSDHYYADLPPKMVAAIREHTAHCLESLRSSILCYPDLNPYPYDWTGVNWHKASPNSKITRQCVDWSQVQEELDTRDFEVEDLIRSTDSSSTPPDPRGK